MKDLILVGGGGHCESVIDVAESAGYHILGVLDSVNTKLSLQRYVFFVEYANFYEEKW